MSGGVVFGFLLVLFAFLVMAAVVWYGAIEGHRPSGHTSTEGHGPAEPSNAYSKEAPGPEDATVRDARLPAETPTTGKTPETNG